MATGGAAAAAAIANAIKASGAIVSLEPEEFLKLLSRAESPLLVVARGALMKSTFKYIFGWRGLTFYTKSKGSLQFDCAVETVQAKTIWIPA